MSLPIPAEIIDDDRLAQAFREVFQLKAQFDLAEEVRKANEAWSEAYNYGARQADDCWCPTCGKRGTSWCNCER